MPQGPTGRAGYLFALAVRYPCTQESPNTKTANTSYMRSYSLSLRVLRAREVLGEEKLTLVVGTCRGDRIQEGGKNSTSSAQGHLYSVMGLGISNSVNLQWIRTNQLGFLQGQETCVSSPREAQVLANDCYRGTSPIRNIPPLPGPCRHSDLTETAPHRGTSHSSLGASHSSLGEPLHPSRSQEHALRPYRKPLTRGARACE